MKSNSKYVRKAIQAYIKRFYPALHDFLISLEIDNASQTPHTSKQEIDFFLYLVKRELNNIDL